MISNRSEMFAIACLLAVLHLLVTGAASETKESDLFPSQFFTNNKNISQYRVRYLHPDGQDTEECLQNQPYPPPHDFESCPKTVDSSIRYCRTLNHSTSGVKSNLIVLVYPGDYRYATDLDGYKNLVIRKFPGCSEDEKANFTCSSSDENLRIRNTINLSINGIVFAKCDTPAVIRNVTNAIVTNCVFRDNLNTGLIVHTSYNTVLESCTFINNTCTRRYNESESLDNSRRVRFSGGLSVRMLNRRGPPVIFNITKCTFMKNRVSINSKNRDDSKIRPHLYIPRGHGGAVAISLNSVDNVTIIIEDSLFMNNRALYNGGGIFISFFSKSNRNTVKIKRSQFMDNTCGETGGAISMNTNKISNMNHLEVQDSMFTRNSAASGGGACTINIQDNLIQATDESPLIDVDNVGVFNTCTFMDNSSPKGGSAVSLVSNVRVDQVSRTTNFTNCNFFTNNASRGDDSAIMAFQFPISLLERNQFRGNIGGGISLFQTRLDNHGQAHFENNVAENGGGIELEDLSLIQVFENSSMIFIGNNASDHGGAISVRSASVGIDTDIIRYYNSRCFIQYDVNGQPFSYDPAKYWRAFFNFTNNTAGTNGGAIFATDIGSCTYAPNLMNDTSGTSDYDKSIFKIDSIFYFEGNNVMSNNTSPRTEIATAPTQLSINRTRIQGAPGETVRLGLMALDGSGNQQEAIWTFNDRSGFYSLDTSRLYHDYKIEKLDNYENCNETTRTATFSLIQIAAGDIRDTKTIPVHVTCCYPGYKLSDDGLCIFNSNRDNRDLILRRDSENHYIYIKSRYYASIDEDATNFNENASSFGENTSLIYAVIPPSFHECESDSNLPGCLFKYNTPQEQCKNGRTGFLCGKCPPHHSVDLTLRNCILSNYSGCDKPSKYRRCGDTAGVVMIVLLFIVGCALVLIFNIGIPSELRGCLFFIQVVGFVYTRTNVEWDFVLSGVFGSGLFLPLAPLPGADALFTSLYGIVLPIVAILTIVAYIISARFIRQLSNKNSFDGIWFLTFFIYKFIADTCFNVLRCQRVYRTDGVRPRARYYYDGTIECFKDQYHIILGSIASIVGSMVILFPILILLISYKRFKLTLQLTDVLNKDLKTSYRWWGSFDLFRRLLFILVVLIFNWQQPLYTQLALLITGLLVFFTFACAQPYKSAISNFIEALVMLDLLVLTSLLLDTSTRKEQENAPILQLLLLLPFIFIALYIAAKIIHYAWLKWCPKRIKDVWIGFKAKVWSKVSWMKEHTTKVVKQESMLVELQDDDQTDQNMTIDNEQLHSVYYEFREELLDEP